MDGKRHTGLVKWQAVGDAARAMPISRYVMEFVSNQRGY